MSTPITFFFFAPPSKENIQQTTGRQVKWPHRAEATSFLAMMCLVSSSPPASVMNVGICVCVLLAALSGGSLSLPTQATVRCTQHTHAHTTYYCTQ